MQEQTVAKLMVANLGLKVAGATVICVSQLSTML